MTTELCSDDQVISLGRVQKPVGLNGILRITSSGEILESLAPGTTLDFYSCQEFRYGLLLKPQKVYSSSLKEVTRSQNLAIDIQITGINIREELEKLKGLFIGLSRAELKPLIKPDEEPYLFEYLCCEVKDWQTKKAYGKIVQIENSAGQDLLSIKTKTGHFMLPLKSNYFHSFSRVDSTYFTEDLDEYLAEVELL